MYNRNCLLGYGLVCNSSSFGPAFAAVNKVIMHVNILQVVQNLALLVKQHYFHGFANTNSFVKTFFF